MLESYEPISFQRSESSIPIVFIWNEETSVAAVGAVGYRCLRIVAQGYRRKL